MSIFVTNLRQEVITAKFKGASLENDLRSLEKVYAAGVTEAVVFYCARILEATLKQAHLQFFGEERGSQPALAEIEQKMFDYNQLQQSRYYWSKGLRLLGNEARHELRRVSREEADFALIFLEFILSWYYCDFYLGPRLPTIHRGQTQPAFSSDNLLPELAWTLDRSRLNPQKLKMIFGTREQEYLSSFVRNFTFPLLLIEIFITLSDHASAERLINALDASIYRQKGALKHRFHQLKGLLFSRGDRLEEALQILESEYTRQQNERYARPDDETVGILAGVYKRLWNNFHKESFLGKSFETYHLGWCNSRTTNTYLGINAASTALWLGKIADAQQIASKVKNIIAKRRRMIQQKTDSRYDLNYWDMATLAEANLLTKDFSASLDLYRLAFSMAHNKPGDMTSTRNQIPLLVDRLSLPASWAEAFLGL